MNILDLNYLIIKKPFCKDEKIIRQRNVYDRWYISSEYGNQYSDYEQKNNSLDFYKVFFENNYVCYLCKKEIDYLIENDFIEIRSVK